MPKSRPKRGPSENDIKFKDELDSPRPNDSPLRPKDRFWKLANQYLKYQMNNPWQWMNANDGMEAAQESQDDYYDALEDMPGMGAVPGMGRYAGDYQVNQQGQVVPGAPEASQTPPDASYGDLGGQVTPEGLFPPGSVPEPLPDVEPSFATGAANYAPASPEALAQGQQIASQPIAGYQGAPPDQVALAQKYGAEYGVDPGVLLAIAKQETQFGEAGLGRKGLTLGYGAFDSGPTMKWAGHENQYRAGAERLNDWGVKGIEDILAGRAASWATDPKWEAGVNAAYKALGGQLSPAQQAQKPLGTIDEILAGIENGTIDPKVLDTLGPGLSDLSKTTGQAADTAEALANPEEEDEEDDE